MGGTWDTASLPARPGLYINFVNAAAAVIKGGARGTVALPLLKYGTAAKEKFYAIEKPAEAVELFGEADAAPVLLVLQGGAREVLVYTMTPPTGEGDALKASRAKSFLSMRDQLEARPFNVFVYPAEVEASEVDLTLAWIKSSRKDGKHFLAVFGGTRDEDKDPALGNARSVKLKDDYAVNLITGAEAGGKSYSSGEYAPYVAGLIAGTGINKSITYAQVSATDALRRLKNSEIATALEKGSLALVHDGEKVKVEQGLVTSGAKIRTIRARQAVATDIPKTAADSYIGKLDNNADGQAALISAVKAYLERLELASVLTDIEAGLDPERKSEGDNVYLRIAYTEIDSMERIFLTIEV